MQTMNRPPELAGAMSVVPGLGQIFNGDNRKGSIFLAVGAINFFILLTLIFSAGIVHTLERFGQAMEVRPNAELIETLNHTGIGSPVSLIFVALFVSFVAYAMRDAYDQARRSTRRMLYADSVMTLPEATGGSYIFHIALMLALTILGFFFLIPPPPRTQVLDIEFLNNPVEKEEKSDSKVRAQQSSRSHLRRDPNRPVSASSPSRASGVKSAQFKPAQFKPAQFKPAQFKPAQFKPAQLKPAQLKPAQFKPAPPSHSPPAAAGSPTLKLPGLPAISRVPGLLPMVLPPSAPGSMTVPAPASVKLGGGPAPGPQTSRSTSSGNATGPAPGPDIAPVHADRGSNTGTGPAPVVASGRFQGARNGHDVPAPARATGRDSVSSPLVAVAPDLGSGGRGSDGARPNPLSMEGKGDEGSPDSREVDFSEYMAALQRAIKRQWYPPKCPTSRRVQVTFKIHRNGSMSNLRLLASSGAAIADQAALKAVQLAAPFRHLPSGSPEDVDIQFTFDYNVFKGTLR